MKEDLSRIFQIAFVFIGTIVGAGLASGQEILNFFTSYGLASFIGIIFCGFFYILIGTIASKISIKYNLNSYAELMNIVSPNILGKLTSVITTLFMLSSASIILAGSGALLNQFFGIPKFIGSLIMMAVAIFFLLRDTNGLIEVNSFIVPILIFTITIITVLYFLFCKDVLSLDFINMFEPKKTGIVLSTLLYSAFNSTSSCGVIVPLSNKIKKPRTMILGVILGAVGLTILSFIINLLLMINQPYIYEYEIPLLLVAQRFGTVIQALLLTVILLEMFSTEISDVYSISKTLNRVFKINFKQAIFLVILIAFPISTLGFSKLIKTLYPIFGSLCLIFISQTIIFYIKNRKTIND
ncbi:YkvI family membrane protein [Caproiciproducens sp. MSJ-32]|uniref:YkvI family membrane protein n=1 Tax=Caproiciproducens sp. MSJ-32 TaxID=2841527 RepID=UPI001C123D57|nr:transporter [Caproiciproducens sp. MSJ-32]MBU5453943.1 transporter [Caproiciproducens sp. MSJ-32]